MKNIKKLLAVLLAALLCVSVTACANNSASSTAVATLETSSTASEGETAESTDKDPAGYDDDIQGLCKYLEDCKVAAGEKVQMSYDVIGAENGYKYVYRYADSAVQLEVYAFPAELSETAKALQDAVRADGTFKVLDNTVPGYLSNDGRFLLIYTDAKSEKEDANKTHKEHVGDDVHRIADDNVQRVRCGLCNVRCNAFDDVDIRLRQFKARLTGFSGHAGRNDDDVGVLCILVISRFNGNRVAEASALNDIHHFALCLLLVDVDQDNLRCDVFIGKRICNGCAYATGTNYGDIPFKSHLLR